MFAAVSVAVPAPTRLNDFPRPLTTPFTVRLVPAAGARFTGPLRRTGALITWLPEVTAKPAAAMPLSSVSTSALVPNVKALGLSKETVPTVRGPPKATVVGARASKPKLMTAPSPFGTAASFQLPPAPPELQRLSPRAPFQSEVVAVPTTTCKALPVSFRL